jgi:hypothetical protein
MTDNKNILLGLITTSQSLIQIANGSTYNMKIIESTQIRKRHNQHNPHRVRKMHNQHEGSTLGARPTRPERIKKEGGYRVLHQGNKGSKVKFVLGEANNARRRGGGIGKGVGAASERPVTSPALVRLWCELRRLSLAIAAPRFCGSEVPVGYISKKKRGDPQGAVRCGCI